jgi:Lysyl oxidase
VVSRRLATIAPQAAPQLGPQAASRARLAALSVALWAALAGCGSSDLAVDAAVDAARPDAIDAPMGVPDLQFVAARMVGSVQIGETLFMAGDCAVLEGCVAAPGRRRLLRFDTVTANLGTGDLVLGLTPPAGERNETFEWSQCHMHHHFGSYTSYELVSGADVVVTGRKQSFCLEDREQVVAGTPRRFSCFDQGISRGWADTYNQNVACQWIDVTDVAPGAYTLRVVVNPLRLLPESDYDNNVFTVEVQL